MDRRFLLFLVFSTAILFGWSALHQVLFPPPPRPVDNAALEAPLDEPDEAPGEENNETAIAEKPGPEKTDAEVEPEKQPETASPPGEAEGTPEPPLATLEIGSAEFVENGYPFLVTLTNRGAALESIALNSPRYGRLDNHKLPLEVVSLETKGHPSLLLALEKGGEFLAERNWEVKSQGSDEMGFPNDVVFRIEWAQRGLAIEKHYHVEPGPNAYSVDLTLRFENLRTQAQEVAYTLTGPNGIPLEGLEYTRTFREVAVAFLNEDSDSVSASTLDVKSLVKQAQKNEVENWTEKPLKYVGVTSQYFAAVLLPRGDQQKDRWDEQTRPVLVGLPKGEGGRETNLSVQLHSRPLVLNPGEANAVVHEYTLFAGPKQPDFVAAYDINSLLDYGMFGFVSKPMVALLNFFYRLVGNYGIAIIMLTVMVRLGMFPLSRKQVLASIKMQELKPELDKLKEKYKNDKEKIGRATMDMYRKHGAMPVGACLPDVVQLPIFMGLYWSLYLSVNLRLSNFLYIDNLAAPDHLFKWGFNVPFLGPWLNLLPIITVILFVVQQKMFTPPAADEQAAMQQKIMSYMMIFIGFMFYHVPSGLCLYFIASSMWGITEKKLMPKPRPPKEPPATQERRKKKDRPLSGSRR